MLKKKNSTKSVVEVTTEKQENIVHHNRNYKLNL